MMVPEAAITPVALFDISPECKIPVNSGPLNQAIAAITDSRNTTSPYKFTQAGPLLPYFAV